MKYCVYVDAGHAGVAGQPVTPGKRTPPIPELNNRQILEHEFNRAVADRLIMLLQKCNIDFLDVSPNPQVDMPLSQRVDRVNSHYRTFMAQNSKNKAIVVSIHANAHKDTFEASSAEGVETFYSTGSTEGLKLANAIHKEVIKGTVQRNRGVKSANFTIIAKTIPPAALVEALFMDSLEWKLMLSKSFVQETSEQIMRGILNYWGIECAEESCDNCDDHQSEINALKEKIKHLQLELETANNKINQAIYQLTK